MKRSSRGRFAAGMAVLASLLVVPLAAEPAQAMPSQAPVSVKLTQTCSTGNFTGEADLTATFTPTGNSGTWTTTVDRYRITRSNGQAGGNKANVDLSFWVNWGTGQTAEYKEAKSADAMIQDGAWHGLGTSGTLTNLPLQSSRTEQLFDQMNAHVVVQFTFDKSGIDPSCRAGRVSDWGRDMADIQTARQQVKYEDPITYCLAITGGGTCTISQTDTKSSEVSVEAGISYAWVTGKVSYKWTTSTAVRVSCASPVMEAGQRFWAYPTGTRYTFSTFSKFFGNRVLAAPGSAFEVDGGVACETASPRIPQMR